MAQEDRYSISSYTINFINNATLPTLKIFSTVYKQNRTIPEILARIRSQRLPTVISGGVVYEAGPEATKILHSRVDTFIRAIDALIRYRQDNIGRFANYWSKHETTSEINHIFEVYNSYLSICFPYLLELRAIVAEVEAITAAAVAPAARAS